MNRNRLDTTTGQKYKNMECQLPIAPSRSAAWVDSVAFQPMTWDTRNMHFYMPFSSFRAGLQRRWQPYIGVCCALEPSGRRQDTETACEGQIPRGVVCPIEVKRGVRGYALYGM